MAEEPLVPVAEEKAKQFAIVASIPRPVRRITIGFVPKPIDDIEMLMPDFTKPPRVPGDVDPGILKVTEDHVEVKKKLFLEAAKWSASTAALGSVCISSTLDDVALFKAEGRGPGTDKPPLCQAVRKWLFDKFPHSWSPRDKWPDGFVPPLVRFIGFHVELFLRTLALECAMPANNCRLPAGLWLTADCIDLLDVLGDEWPRRADLVALVARRKPPGADGAVWDKHLEGWAGPGVDAEKDHYLGLELAAQLGFFRD